MQDIEDLVKVGQLIQSCPYYGTRAALASAEVLCPDSYFPTNACSSQVVTMPYNVLLHKVSGFFNVCSAFDPCDTHREQESRLD